MKRTLLTLLILFFALYLAQAQRVEITPFGGYVFPTRWNASNGSLYFYGNAQYGGILDIGMSRVVDIELMYNRIDTKASSEAIGYPNDDVPLSENYYMVGVTKNFRVNPTVSPFLGMSLGGLYLAPKTSQYYSYWFFAMGVNGGAKIYFNKFVGIRLQAQLLMPVQSGGFSFYYGTGGGGSTVYLNSTLFDFGFTGGLIFRIGR
ncbi:MAG TPA: hypothetical protein PKN44_05620 [Bacteroidales bacterium]|nr:hypothetical protein [Bacteroidales bacterium]